jgi:hypothetical protein
LKTTGYVNPGKEYWKAVQWISRYLCVTSKACLKFGKTSEELAGYVYSDFAADLNSSYGFTVGGCVVR